MKFIMYVREELELECEIEAESEEEAFEILEEKYHGEEIVLDYSNLVKTSFFTIKEE